MLYITNKIIKQNNNMEQLNIVNVKSSEFFGDTRCFEEINFIFD